MNIGDIVAHLKLNIQDFSENLEQARSQIQDTEQNMSKMGKVGETMTKVGTALTAGVTVPLVAMGKAALSTYQQFEVSMDKVAALSGATGDDLKTLEETAKHMGATTKYSASEAADALGYMALAGWDTQQMTQALPDVLNLATAGQMNLAAASDMVTDYLSAFGLQAKDATHFTDVLSYAQANSNTSATQLGEAFKNCAVNAKAFGLDSEQTTAILGKFADQGLKGSEAGTALSAVVRDMTSKMDKGCISIGKTNVSITDANGNFRSMSDILSDVEKATDGMSEAERVAALQTTFTADSIKGMNMLLGAGSTELSTFTNELYNCDGAASKMAETMGDNLEGKLAGLSSAFEAVQITIAERLAPAFELVVESLTKLLQWFNNLNPAAQTMIVVIAGIAAAIGPLLLTMGLMISSWGKVKLAVDSAKGAFIAMKAVIAKINFTSMITSLKGVASGFLATGKALLACPWTWVAVAIAAVAAGLVYLFNTNDGFRTKVIQVWENVKSKAQEIFGAIGEYINKLATVFKEGGIKGVFETLATDIGNLVVKIREKLPEMLKAGGELIMKLIQGIGQAIPKLLQTAAEIIPQLFESWLNNLSTMIEIGAEIITKIIEGIAQSLPQIIETATTIITNFINKITEKLPDLIQSGVQILTNIINGIVNALPQIIPVAVECITTLVMALVSALPLLIEAGIQILITLVNAIIDNLPMIIDAAIMLIEALFEALIDNLPAILDAGIQCVIALGEGLIQAIPQLLDAVGKLCLALLQALGEIVVGVVKKGWEIGKSFCESIGEWFSELPGKVWDWLKGCLDKIADWGKDMINKAKDAGKQFVDNVINFIKELPETIFYWLCYVVSYVVLWTGQMIEKAKETGKQFIDNVVTFFKELPGKISQWLTNTINKVAEWTKNLVTKAKEAGKQFIDNVVTFVKELPGKIKQTLENVISAVTSWASKMISKAQQAGRDFVNKIVTFIKQLPSKIASALNSVISRVSSFVSNFASKGRQAASDFSSKIKSGLSSLPSQMATIGKNIISGIVRGVTNGASSLYNSMKNIAKNALNAAKNALGINSPSRVFRDIVGTAIPEGIAVGVDANTDEAVNSVSDMTKSLVNSVNLDPLKATVNSTGFSNNMYNNSSNPLLSTLNSILNVLSNKNTETSSGLNVNIEQFNNNTEEDINRLMQRMEAQIRLNNLGKGVR